MKERVPYTYFIGRTLRPARISKRADGMELVIKPPGVFWWQRLAIACEYDLLVQMQLPKGPMASHPVRACNLGSPQLPMWLHSEVPLPAYSHLKITLHNTLSSGRKWNRVEIALLGELEFPEELKDEVELLEKSSTGLHGHVGTL